MKQLSKIGFSVVFFGLIMVLSCSSDAQAQQLTTRDRVVTPKYDVMTMEFADPSIPKIIFKAMPGKFYLIPQYSEAIFEQVNWVMENECERLECTTIEIIIIEDAYIKSIKTEVLSAASLPTKPKNPQDRIAQIQITIPTDMNNPVNPKTDKKIPKTIA